MLARTGLQGAMQAVVTASGLPFATMFLDKSVLDESQPAYIGMYDGALMNEDVRDFVEGCDLVLAIGTASTTAPRSAPGRIPASKWATCSRNSPRG
jgi:indolepyruvate decarboxylase